MNSQTCQNKPTAAYVLALLTGICNIIAGIVLLFLAAVASSSYDYYYGYYFGTFMLTAVGLWVMIAAVILIAAAANLNSNPLDHSKWGAVILIFSILVGSILGIIGGILALTFKPIMTARTRMCVNCGRQIDESLRFCPHCGHQTVA
jgi:drug/metabolite transporter (DMT)-like permease